VNVHGIETKEIKTRRRLERGAGKEIMAVIQIATGNVNEPSRRKDRKTKIANASESGSGSEDKIERRKRQENANGGKTKEGKRRKERETEIRRRSWNGSGS
jgi:hypothetical protein